jgi:hypothetical protein
MKLFSIALPALLLLLAVGCTRDITDPDDPVPTAAIQANTTSIRSYGIVVFTLTAGGAPIDSIEVNYGDMARGAFICGGKTEVSIKATHAYIWKGRVTVTMTVRSGRKYSLATLQIDIAVDTPPHIRTLSFDFAEGDSLIMPIDDLIGDYENDPFQYSISVSDPRVLVVRHGTFLAIKAIDEDFNGQAVLRVSYSYAMSDSIPRSGIQEITIFINPRDCISGSVEDIMAGTYAGARDPALVLKPPYTAGSVTVDGESATLNLATGTFKSLKLKPRLHSVSWGGFATAAGESSFAMTKAFPPGDREVTLLMHSTAGTQMSPADLRSFYREANFRLKGNGREGLYAPDYSHVQGLSDYLSANGTVIEGHTLAGFTPEQQELLAGWIADEIDAILPAEYRIPVTRGKTTDSLPVVEEHGVPMPARGTAVAFVEQTPGSITVPMVFTEGYIIERAWIRLRDDGSSTNYGLSRAWALGSFLARRAAPCGVVLGARFAGKSCMAVDGNGPTDHLTGADKKLLWLPLLHAPGTSLDTWWRLH